MSPSAKGTLQVLLDFYPQGPIAEAPYGIGFVATAPDVVPHHILALGIERTKKRWPYLLSSRVLTACCCAFWTHCIE